MCTSVVEVVRAEGAGKGDGGWFPVTSAVVSYDHPHHALLEEAITIDFVNPGARARGARRSRDHARIGEGVRRRARAGDCGRRRNGRPKGPVTRDQIGPRFGTSSSRFISASWNWKERRLPCSGSV